MTCSFNIYSYYAYLCRVSVKAILNKREYPKYYSNQISKHFDNQKRVFKGLAFCTNPPPPSPGILYPLKAWVNRVKCLSNSIRYNCQKICCWLRKLKPYWKSEKRQLFFKWSTILWFKSFFQDEKDYQGSSFYLSPKLLNTRITNETFQQSGKQDSFTHLLGHVYEYQTPILPIENFKKWFFGNNFWKTTYFW